MTTYAPNLPRTMKAFQYTKVGNPADVLTLAENLPLPVPTGSNILIKMNATSINPVDWKAMKGALPRYLMPKIKTPGLDIAGVVVGLGPNVGKSNKPGVQKFSIGDRVMALQHLSHGGTWQDYSLVDESYVIKTPAEWDDSAAAAFPAVGVTIYKGLVAIARIKSGDKVLVNGASGGTGSIAVQMATALGASVVGICSKTNIDLVKNLGAVDVVDYTTTKVYEKYTNKDFDIILDAVGSPQLYANSVNLLKPTGRFIQIAVSDEALFSIVGALHLVAQVVGRMLYSFLTRGPSFSTYSTSADGEQLAAATHIMVRANARPTVDGEYLFEFDKVLEAVAYSQTGRAKGKIIIVAPGHQ
ncbi:NADPh quinone reductase [Podila verticillata]|nr:NADPh quinone reductase [Podila verticillata]